MNLEKRLFRNRKNAEPLLKPFTFNFSPFTFIHAAQRQTQTLPPAAGVAVATATGADDRLRVALRAGRKFDCEETYPDDLPLIGVSEYLSTLKSEAYPVPLLENDILLTADTVVLAGGEFRMTAEGTTWHGGEILGKPRDRDDARRMLKILSGAHHLVTTGVTLRSAARMTHFTSLTYVWFRTLTDEEIAYYVDTFQPFDKAGAYGIQEWIGYAAIECIEGSFYNVMGLPVQKVYTELDKFLNP